MRGRMRDGSSYSWLATWLGAIGLLLALAAGLSFAVSLDAGAGDVAAIESSLAPESRTSPGPEPDAPNILPSEEAQPEVTPLWTRHEESDFEDLGAANARIPVGLRIEALDVDAPVDPYGVNQRTGQMAVPTNVRDVAWYKYGPSPGQAGSAVLAAHVDLESQGRGVFFDLKSLDPGEVVTVSYHDGSEQRFEVKARDTYEKDELPLDVIFSRQGAPVLTLITCGGGFSASARSYDSNVVVYATPLEGPPVDQRES